MDPVLFPRTTRYLRALPDGLTSYLEVRCKATLYRAALRSLPEPLDPSTLDPALASYVEDPRPVSAWIPEVVNTALFLAVADRVFRDDDAFLAWVHEFSGRVFETPMYRILMLVASPQRLAKGAVRRWNNFHEGIEYEVDLGANGTNAIMRFPPHVYDRLVFRGNLMAIQAAYRATDAKSAVVELLSMTPTEARFRTIWYPERG